MQGTSADEANPDGGDALEEMNEFVESASVDFDEPPAVLFGEQLHVPSCGIHRACA